MSRSLLLKIFTNQTCSLCVDAKTALSRIQKQVPFTLEEVDINMKGNEEWKKKYCFDVPVVHAKYVDSQLSNSAEISEKILAMHRIDEPTVVKKLKEMLGEK